MTFKAGDRVIINSNHFEEELWGEKALIKEVDRGDGYLAVEIGIFTYYVAPDELSPIPRLGPMSKKILECLFEKKHITGVEAAAVYRCRDLPKRISELRACGYNISKVMRADPTGQRYARYTLAA